MRDSSAGRRSALALVALVALAAVVAAACEKGPSGPLDPQLPPPSIAEDLREVALKADSLPPGAALWVDGADTGKLTPAEVKLETGRDHEIELRRAEHLVFRTKVFAAPHEDVELKPVLTRGVSLQIDSEPAGASVSVDGQEVATTPGVTPALAAGKHRVRLALPGHVALEREVLLLLEDPKTHQLKVRLQRGRELRVTSTPPGASIVIDNKETGLVTPASFVVAPAAKLTVRLELATYAPAQRVLQRIKAGDETIPVDFTLEKASVTEVNKKIAELESKVERLQAQLEKLQKKEQGGFFLEGKSASQAYQLEQQIAGIEKQLDDLGFQLSELKEDRERLMGEPGQADASP